MRRSHSFRPCRMAIVLNISLWTSESIVDVFGYAYRSFILSALAKISQTHKRCISSAAAVSPS